MSFNRSHFNRNSSQNNQKIGTYIGGVIAIGLAITWYINRQDMNGRFETLDQSAHHVFTDLKSCTDEGYNFDSCTASFEAANALTERLGTRLSYNSASTCRIKHGSCETRVTEHDNYDDDGYYIDTDYNYSYHPYIAGWLASQDNIDVAVPLYESALEGTAIRRDGKVFELPTPPRGM